MICIYIPFWLDFNTRKQKDSQVDYFVFAVCPQGGHCDHLKFNQWLKVVNVTETQTFHFCMIKMSLYQ